MLTRGFAFFKVFWKGYLVVHRAVLAVNCIDRGLWDRGVLLPSDIFTRIGLNTLYLDSLFLKVLAAGIVSYLMTRHPKMSLKATLVEVRAPDIVKLEHLLRCIFPDRFSRLHLPYLNAFNLCSRWLVQEI